MTSHRGLFALPVALLLAASLLPGCALGGGRSGGGYRELAGAVTAGEVERAIESLRGGAAARLTESERASLFGLAYDRAKSAYEELESGSPEFRNLLEVLWLLDGEDPRYLYLATVYAYLTEQHEEVVRLGAAALATPMRVRVAYMLAESHRALGDLPRARAYYEMVLAENLVGFEDVRARCRARLEELQ